MQRVIDYRASSSLLHETRVDVVVSIVHAIPLFVQKWPELVKWSQITAGYVNLFGMGYVQFCKILMMVCHIWNHTLWALSTISRYKQTNKQTNYYSHIQNTFTHWSQLSSCYLQFQSPKCSILFLNTSHYMRQWTESIK